VKEDSPDYAAVNCPRTAEGLHGVRWVTVSPDGKNVYLAANESDAIGVYARNQANGELSFAGCLGNAGASGCSSAIALDGAQGLGLSPDGGSLYAASVVSDGLAAFRRSATTGALAQLPKPGSCVTQSGTGGQCQTNVGLRHADWITVAPDGRFAYAASAGSFAVTAYSRVLVDDGTDPSNPPGGPSTNPSTTARLVPRALTLKTRPRVDRRRPYRFRAKGRLRLPAGVAPARACTGTVAVAVKRGRRTLKKKRARLSRSCRYSVRLGVRIRRLRPGRRVRLRIEARFRGNALLTSRRAKSRRVWVRR
jgi:hypothetical protein